MRLKLLLVIVAWFSLTYVGDTNIALSQDDQRSMMDYDTFIDHVRNGEEVNGVHVQCGQNQEINFSELTTNNIFNNVIIIKDSLLECQVIATAIIFENTINFTGTTFDELVSFDSSTFEQNVNFNAVIFTTYAAFSSSTFNSTVEFSGTDFSRDSVAS